MSIRLGVNIDHVATIRNARGEKYPSPLKAAIIAQAKALSRETGAQNIRVNVVAPGLTNTDMMNNNTRPEIIKDVSATLDWLSNQNDVDMDRLGIIGHCMGGRMALLGASTHDVFKACVPYYPGNMFKPWSDDGPPPFDLLGQIKGSVLGFFGNDDKNPSAEDKEKISSELTRFGIQHEFHGYDGAGHAFQNFLAPERYREEATRNSWAKTIPYLDQTL